MFRVLQIMASTLPREAARLDLALMRGAMTLAITFFWLPLMWERLGPTSLATYARWSLFLLSLLLEVFLAARLAGDSVGDKRSGFLQLLTLSGISPWQWLLLRWWQILVGFVSVWAVRIPFLMWLSPVVGSDSKLTGPLELLLLLTFLAITSLTLWAAHRAKTRQTAISGSLIRWLVLEFLLIAPSMFVASLQDYTTLNIPNELILGCDQLALIGVFSQARLVLAGIPPDGSLWATVGVYSLLVLAVNWSLERKLRTDAGEGELAGAAAAPQQARVSRRSWPDALAWQAYTIHAGGTRSIKLKSAGLILATLLLAYAAMAGFREQAYGLASCLAFALLMFTASRPRDCLSREIQDQTITMLLLTPHDPVEIYAGWRRGSLRLIWPEVLFSAGLAVAFGWANLYAPAVVFGILGVLLCSGPFLMLSPLVPMTPGGWGMGVLIAGIAATLATIAIVSSAVVGSSLLFPVVAVPLTLVFNSVLRETLLPKWLEIRLDKVR